MWRCKKPLQNASRRQKPTISDNAINWPQFSVMRSGALASKATEQGRTMFRFAAKRFFLKEHGAVTVDWTVLTAAILAFGLAMGILVASGATTLGTTINAALGSLLAPDDAPADPDDVPTPE
jgi:hypothetical protein